MLSPLPSPMVQIYIPPEIKEQIIFKLNIKDAISMAMTSHEWRESVESSREYWLKKAHALKFNTTCHILAKQYCVRVTMSLYKSHSLSHAKQLRTVLKKIDQRVYYMLSAFLNEYCSNIEVFNNQHKLIEPYQSLDQREGTFTIVARTPIRKRKVIFVVAADRIYYRENVNDKWSRMRDEGMVRTFTTWINKFA